MQAFAFHGHGGPEVMKLTDLPTPEPGEGEVRVRVKAAALNRLDLFVRKGWPGLKLDMPHVPASDIAGVVDEPGPGVEGFREGERVVVYPDLSCGRCEKCLAGENVCCPEHRLIGEHTPGGLAEYVTAPAGNLRALPDSVPFETAAAASLTFVTAWRMLVTRARLKAGETVLIVGSGGGVNTAALQIARLAGAREITVLAGGPDKAKRARELGADPVLDYHETPDWHKAVLKRTGGRGVDVVVDNVGEATWEKSLKSLTTGGRLVTVGGTTGYNPKAGINYVFWKQLDILGSTMGTPREYDTAMSLVYQGRLQPVIDRVYALEDAGEAFRALETGEHFGKIVVTP